MGHHISVIIIQTGTDGGIIFLDWFITTAILLIESKKYSIKFGKSFVK